MGVAQRSRRLRRSRDPRQAFTSIPRPRWSSPASPRTRWVPTRTWIPRRCPPSLRWRAADGEPKRRQAPGSRPRHEPSGHEPEPAKPWHGRIWTCSVAALYDIHGNLPALEAVLAEIAREPVDLVDRRRRRDAWTNAARVARSPAGARRPARFIRGNGDRERLAEVEGRSSAMPESLRRLLRLEPGPAHARRRSRAVGDWAGGQAVSSLPGLGSVLFCHATPRNDEEIVTRLMSDDVLRPKFDGARTSWCAVTRTCSSSGAVGATRLVNAGSVGMPFERPAAAYWLRLGPASSCAGPPTTWRRRRSGSAHGVSGRRGIRPGQPAGAARHARGLHAIRISQLEGVAGGA